MARFSLIALLGSFFAGIAVAAPVPVKLDLVVRANTTATGTFTEQAYADFQISDGVGGTAVDEANAVFVDPFAGVDLSTISSDTLDAINTMREAAESAETDDFDPQIDAATGAAADALSVGKTKNKVLKLTGEIQAINIKIAQAQASGDDTSDLEDSLNAEQTKLNTNIAADKANAGKTSQGVA
ncbi:MAG: hypothetical protein NXY57DRAFT_1019910 [Lentinula lateritia]|uniref:Small secreted protein n=1 Tax=Lentinula lateritia TaxID=40482 RepID=A0ABQ8VPT7_9AGAR|nr:hypothetical protein F5051DRAFT_420919 [Lentinula edodes]KAJ3891240.1 hypothetical protein GG344DRAFT_77077 [Lentinula edodes]KAJ3928698.1 MAG: hypothetical protein NXY57DRAFT_1019910 [Lentinula lateritia]KAJ4498409.1 hypothetical protein C8R41DRAFT_818990 [Lentinula lateritia]